MHGQRLVQSLDKQDTDMQTAVLLSFSCITDCIALYTTIITVQDQFSSVILDANLYPTCLDSGISISYHEGIYPTRTGKADRKKKNRLETLPQIVGKLAGRRFEKYDKQ